MKIKTNKTKINKFKTLNLTRMIHKYSIKLSQFASRQVLKEMEDLWLSISSDRESHNHKEPREKEEEVDQEEETFTTHLFQQISFRISKFKVKSLNNLMLSMVKFNMYSLVMKIKIKLTEPLIVKVKYLCSTINNNFNNTCRPSNSNPQPLTKCPSSQCMETQRDLCSRCISQLRPCMLISHLIKHRSYKTKLLIIIKAEERLEIF